MSGIYIPGVTVPEDNTILLRIFPESDGIYYTEQLDIDEDILDKYFAIPVPDHGRTIDADALSQEIEEYIDEYSAVDERGLHCEKWCAMKEAEMAINDAPTIIPADKEGET